MSTSADRPVVTQLTAHHSEGRGGERKAPNHAEAVTRHTVLCFLCPNKNLFRIFVCLMVGKGQSELNETKKHVGVTEDSRGSGRARASPPDAPSVSSQQ